MSIAGGQAENHIKSWKTHLAADRTSCSGATANQFRLFLHAGAYWLMWGLRVSMPKRSMWRVAQFDTLRLRLIKIAARVVEMKTMIRVHLPTSCPAQDILRFALGRIPRLVTCPTGHEPQNIPRRPFTPQPLTLSPRPQAGADEPRPNVCEVQKNHPNPAQPCANSSKSCIKRANSLGSASGASSAKGAGGAWAPS